MSSLNAKNVNIYRKGVREKEWERMEDRQGKWGLQSVEKYI